MSVVDVSVWRADIERQMAEFPKCGACNGAGGGTTINQWGEPEDHDCGACHGGRLVRGEPLYIVGEGVPEKWEWHDGQRWHDGTTRLLPPVGWPSPNETTPCEACGGEGILGINLEPPDQGIHWCDRCTSGVTAGTRTELRVTCSNPNCTDGVDETQRCKGPNCDGGHVCSSCHGDGSVLWATATWRTLPVVGHSLRGGDRTGIESGDSEANHNAPCTLWSHGQWSPLTLPISVRPGMWVAQLTGIELA